MTNGSGSDGRATLRVEVRDGVGIVTLARPHRLNAITYTLLVELREALLGLGARDDVRAVVLAGEGRAFCAGLDLEAGLADPALDDPVEAMQAGMEAGAAVTWAIRTIPQPVIAAVQGHAVGAGFAFAVAADVRMVGADARFSAPFLRLGMSVGDFGLSWLLPRIVGHGRAAHLFFSAGALDADQAVAAGLAAGISADPLAAATELASHLADQPPYGVRASKRLLDAGLSSPLHDHLAAEARAQTIGALSTAAQAAMAEALAATKRRDR
ncbi:enoyl-CoA hydratase/isomerase family protein [Dactylosporangium sucinum]|uniref:Enoyl-CoA hydratase n=1 Tax=Dactylosporangium sucinum TaxID=1424081 RepID=A0A917X8X9_9ACTN|nr:enoyl-CoA hydratase/isomerase family protein [Dactylosporangium sucinum]GGM89811.1 enoyl-CoA hydratase [Dactylosporangium sucinum]